MSRGRRLQQNGVRCAHATEKTQNDENLVQDAAQQDSDNCTCVAKETRNNGKMVVVATVQQRGEALHDASHDMQNTEQAVVTSEGERTATTLCSEFSVVHGSLFWHTRAPVRAPTHSSTARPTWPARPGHGHVLPSQAGVANVPHDPSRVAGSFPKATDAEDLQGMSTANGRETVFLNATEQMFAAGATVVMLWCICLLLQVPVCTSAPERQQYATQVPEVDDRKLWNQLPPRAQHVRWSRPRFFRPLCRNSRSPPNL